MLNIILIEGLLRSLFLYFGCLLFLDKQFKQLGENQTKEHQNLCFVYFICTQSNNNELNNKKK